MKIRFSKVATLFLAGAAVLAAGCTDYQSDINDIYVKIDELASKESVASLQSQVVVLSNALDALKSDHSKDIAALQSSIDALKSADAQFTSQIAALDGKIGDNAKDIASLKTALANTDKTIADHVAAFNEYKTQVQSALTELSKKDTELAGKIEAAETALRAEIAAVQKLVEAEAATRADADKVLGERIDAALKEIAAESNRAQLKEKELQDAIDAEVAARKAADEAAAAALAAEVKRAEDAEALLDAAIKAEEKARAAADEVLTKRIAAEERAREVADSLLNEAIKAEAIVRDEAIKAAVKAEAEARIEADSLLQAYAESIDKKVDNLKKEYDAFKADVEGEIAGLKTRLDAAEAAIKNIDASIKTINGQIKDLQKADSLLRVDMEAGDQYVLDSLNVVKAATEKSIAALQNAVKDIVAVNKDQSDSLKAAFAKFNDYVLTTTFEAYQNEVEAALKAKADTAALNAAVKRIDDHDLRIVALEAYKNELVETIIPGLEAADKALKASIDSLGGVVAEVKENVDTLNSHMAKAEATIAQHTLDIAALSARTSALEQWQAVAEENIQSLLSRIRSVEFVPDYTDKYITIEQVVMPVVGWVPSEEDNDPVTNYLETVYVYNAPSEITYKVYPTEMADSLVNYFKENAKYGKVYFDVVNVKGSGSRFDTEEEVKRPELEILDVNSSDRTAGAITFTVKAKNVDDFGKLANYIYGGFNHSIGNNALIPDKIAFFGNLIGMIQNIPFHEGEENPVKDFNPFLSSALVIEGVDGGNITSEYNIWTPGVTGLIASPEFGYPDVNSRYGVAFPSELSQDVEYTDTEVYSIADSVDLYALVSLRGEQEKAMKFAEATELLGVDVTPDFAALRYYYCDHAKYDDHKVVFTENPKPAYGWSADTSAFTSDPDKFIKLMSQLDPDPNTLALRKAAIGDEEEIYYNAIINGVAVDYLRTYFHITKAKAQAVVEPIVINWEYGQDVATDAAIFHGGANDGEGAYSRTGIVLTINEEESSLTEKGVQIADFDGASAVIKDYVVKNSKGEDVTDLDIKLELSPDKNSVLADISNFAWDETYTITATYDLEDAVVSVSGSIQTIDRHRTPITLNYGTYTTEYKKDMDFMVRACMTFGNGQGYHTPTHENFTTSPIDVRDSIAHLYGESAKVPENLAADLWKNGKDKAFVVSTEEESFYVEDPCVNKLYRVLYSDYKKAGDVVEYPDVEFYTYYGQKIIVKAKSTVTAPKYDFRHDNVQVLDDTKSKKYWTMPDVKLAGRFYSTAEPKFEDDIYPNFKNFNIEAIDFDKLFYIVDSKNVNLTADSVSKAGLVANFEFRYPTNVESNNDNREDTEITITDNKLSYYGYDDTVSVKGTLAIKNDDGSMFYFPTSFDEGFESIYAAVIPEGEPTVGRYAKYQVVKFMPLQKLSAGEGTTIELYDAGKYYEPILKSLTLFDNRLPAKYPMVPVSSSAGESFTNGVNLFDGSDWKVGDGVNGFAAPDGDGSIYISKDVYHITTNYKLVPTKPEDLSDNEWNDIYSRMKIKDTDDNNMPIAPQLEFDYTQQAGLDKIVIPIKVELLHPWIKTADYDYVNITIVNKK